MKYTINDIKLKHLYHIGEDSVGFKELMEDIMGYKNTWIDRRILFRFKFKEIYDIIAELQLFDIDKLEVDKDCKIKPPGNIDALSYQSRIEIDALREKGSEDKVSIIAEMIALSCFNEVHKVKFSSNTELFKSWKEHVLNQPLLQMIGLYNYIEKSISASNKDWNEKFLEVNVDDRDYEAVNGHLILGRFNLLNVIKKIMTEFNIGYEEAFLMEYRLVQTNSLEAASKGYVGEQMRIVKERKFKQQRG